ncbi:MAG: hypothetical protein IKY26_09555 [Erysipelotrichaceae bacterium]|nr:hypothetical protein [Erysipelotrichaceae bacterium]
MTSFKIDKINKFQILDTDTLEPIADFDCIGNATVESEIETSSLSKEKLSFNHELSFECELTYCSPLLHDVTDFNSMPLYVEYDMPILIQARWHKNPRINKKWLKRYGMKQDKLLVRCNIDSISLDNSYDPYNLMESKGYNMTLSDMQYKLKPHQLRKNLAKEITI